MRSVAAIAAASIKFTFGILLSRGKNNTACNVFLSCFRDVDPKAAIVRYMADVPAIDRMWSKGFSHWWCFVQQYFCTGRDYRSSVIIEGTI